MKAPILVTLALATLVVDSAEAQRTTRVAMSGGEVALIDPARLATRIPSLDTELRGRVLVSGDSAQRIALNDFDWKGHVASIEIDEEDARTFWDVKIVPDANHQTIVRYRIDAVSGGILNIKEFKGVRGLVRRKP